MVANEPFEYVLHIDWDYPWPEHWLYLWEKSVRHLLEKESIHVDEIIKKPSPSREGGSHVWIHVHTYTALSDDYINMLQFLCGDHHTRVWINILRVDRRIKKWWNKLFTRHIWKKPLPKRCQKCKLREILYEMKEEHARGGSRYES